MVDILGWDRTVIHPSLTLLQYFFSRILVPAGFRPDDNSITQATVSFGDALIYKANGSMRIFFQNVKGLTYSPGVEDYRYYLSEMAAYSVDCFGLAETNTAWQHYYLQLNYRECVQRQFRIGKTVFGYPSKEIDSCTDKETFQAGGCLTTIHGKAATMVQGTGIIDPTGFRQMEWGHDRGQRWITPDHDYSVQGVRGFHPSSAPWQRFRS